MKFKSFKHAFKGIVDGIKNETNFRVMVISFLLVLILNLFFKVTRMEWVITLLCSGVVLSSELLNSALESTLDVYSKEHHILIKNAKDFAAGAVLIMSVISFVIAMLIYMPYFL